MELEVRIQKQMHHPNITRLYDVIESAENLYLVLEYEGGGDLYYYLDN